MQKIGLPALSHTFFGRLTSNFVYKLIFKRSGLRLTMDKFWQISIIALDLCKKWFQCSILGIFWLIVFKLCIRVDFWEEWFAIVDR